MATISFDLSSTANCPRPARSRTPRRSPYGAPPCRWSGRASGAASCRRARRPARPSRHHRPHPGEEAAPERAGSRRAKTRPKVSWLGMPSGKARNVRSHAPSPARRSPPPPSRRPRRSPHTARSSRCPPAGGPSPRSTRGSGRGAKCAPMLVPLARSMRSPRSAPMAAAPRGSIAVAEGAQPLRFRCNRPGCR
jgi:hypothetical protein